MVEPINRVHDAHGFDPVESNLGYSFGRAYDSERMVLKHELESLEDFAPKTTKVEADQACLSAAEMALEAMAMQVNSRPQPTWLQNDTDGSAFSARMEGLFKATAAEHDVSPSQMNDAVGRYNLRPASSVDVNEKVSQVKGQITQMDTLVKSIDGLFNNLAQMTKSPDEFKALSAMGVHSIDGLYAVDPGRFKPKDHNGNTVEYDPKNLIHSLQAIEEFLKDPAKATVEQDIKLFGPKAVEQLRETLSDRMPAVPGQNFGVSNNIINQINNGPLPGSSSQTVDENNETDQRSAAFRRKQMQPSGMYLS